MNRWVGIVGGGVFGVAALAAAFGPADPEPPTEVVAQSNFSTPTSVAITWVDPLTTEGGAPLQDFAIEILRDGFVIHLVDQGIQALTDSLLTDGHSYSYSLRTVDEATDFRSALVHVDVIAGGSPIPAPPSAFGCTPDSGAIVLQWTNPSTQSDGTVLDDLAGIRIWRNAALLHEMVLAPTDTSSTENYIDTSILPGVTYSYEIAAVDSETPIHESMRVANSGCTSGTFPNILLWKPTDILSSSPDTLEAVLHAIGEPCAQAPTLTTFSNDLNAHEIVYAFLGISPNNHLLTDPEGLALEAFVFQGGKLIVEGGDCFNYDPEIHGTYDIRPLLGLADGPDGTRDIFHIQGVNELDGFSFQYLGPNRFTDDLVPASSFPILMNSANADIIGVLQAEFGQGRAAGFVFEVGHLVDVPSLDLANTKIDLLQSLLHLLRDNDPPAFVLSPSAVTDTLFIGDTADIPLVVNNPGAIRADLTYSAAFTDSASASWVSASPLSGTLPGNGTDTVTIHLDPQLLSVGHYETKLAFLSNAPDDPADTVSISLDVTDPPDLAVTPPTLTFHVVPHGGTKIDSLSLSNQGASPLIYSLAWDEGGAERLELNQSSSQLNGGNRYRGNIFHITESTNLHLIEINGFVSTPTSMEFFVYESSQATGMYTKVFSETRIVNAGTWPASTPFTLPLVAEKFYFIGAGWQGSIGYTNDGGTTVLPLAFALGECLGSAGGNLYPPPGTKFLGPASSLHALAFEWGDLADVSITSSTSGQLFPNDATEVLLTATGQADSGTFPARLVVTSNDPSLSVQTKRVIPLSVVVDGAVEVPDAAASPGEFRLSPARPTPFRKSTEISFQLPRPMLVDLSVFDVAGRRVRTLSRTLEPAGPHRVVWDGLDMEGRAVSPGVYMIRLQTPEKSAAVKTIHVR